jgi:hypothetical protein
MENMETLGYRKWSATKPEREIEAEMMDEEGTESWTGPLAPFDKSGHLPFWWRPARGKDDLWKEIMILRQTGDPTAAV